MSAKYSPPSQPTTHRGASSRDETRAARREHPRFRRTRAGLVLDDALGHHVTMRLVDERVFAATPAALRRTARVLLARGAARGLLSFGVADTHLHAVLACDRATAGVFAQTVEASLRAVLSLAVPFEAARIRPIVEQRHLAHAVRYALRQDARHGLALDPCRDGSALPELLAMRVVDTHLAARVAARLPRWSRAELLGLLGVELAPGPLDFAQLADAAAAAFALPELDGQDAERSTARRAAVQLALAAGLRTRRVAELLSVTARSAQRLALAPAPRAALRAVELQLRLRTALAARERRDIDAEGRSAADPPLG